jgi:hypothetical protein
MKTYYPSGTKVYIAPGNIFHLNTLYNGGDFLITNRTPPEPFKVHCENPAEFAHPVPTGRNSDQKVFEDIALSPEDGFLAGVHNAREQLKEAMARGDGAKIGEARMQLDQAERAFRAFRDARRDDDTKQKTLKKAKG